MNRWFLSILGLVLLSLIVWYAGAAISLGGYTPLASEISRLLVIGGLILAWGIWNMIAALRSRRTSEAMADGLTDTSEEATPEAAQAAARGDAAEEVESLRLSLRQAIQELKKSGRKGPGRRLHRLPWYIIIGPPGVGKTTALYNSGLDFPLEDRFGRARVIGEGGTRNCDWFFANEAVLVDTAGRYVTRDSDETVDRAAWEGFLHLLRKYRGRQAVDGIIVALSIDDLATSNKASSREHAAAVRRRIQEIYTILQIRAPVYVILTKFDLLAGFTEFFEDLRQDELKQVWGTTFPLAKSRVPNAALDLFPDEFDALIERLDERVTRRLQEEPDLERRDLILGFPQQLAMLRQPILDFLADAFRESRYEAPTLLRGVYLSSATQVGTPVDRLVTAVARTFGLTPAAMRPFSRHGRAYFLETLLRDVVIREANLVTATDFFSRNRPWILRGFYATATLLTFGVLAGEVSSYIREQRYVEEVDAAVDAYLEECDAERLRGADVDVFNELYCLELLRNLPRGYAERDEPAPFLMGFNLFQGKKLGSAAIQKYGEALRSMLLPRVIEGLEKRLAESLESDDKTIYETLKIYKMLTTDSQKREDNAVATFVASDWERKYPEPRYAEQRVLFHEHLDAMLKLDRNPFKENAELVAAAERYLLQIPPEQRFYDRIKTVALQEREHDWTLAEHLSPIDQRFFVRRSGKSRNDPVPGFFTVEGASAMFLPMQKEALALAENEWWVLGRWANAAPDTPAERLHFTQKMSLLYFEDYIRTWQSFISDIGIVKGRTVSDQADLVLVLSGSRSPIKSLVQEITRQTSPSHSLSLLDAVPEAPELPAKERDSGQGGQQLALQSKEDVVGYQHRSGQGGQQLALQSGLREALFGPAAKVDTYFQDLNELVEQDGPQAPAIDAALDVLTPLHGCLIDALDAAPVATGRLETGRDAVVDCRRVVRDIRDRARFRVRSPHLARWMQDVAFDSYELVRGDIGGQVERDVQQEWRTRVADFCRRAIDGRHPFDRGSPNDVNLQDFSRFFGPGGAVDSFFQQYLAPIVDTSSKPWRWTGDLGHGMSPQSLGFFEVSDTIQGAFFMTGASQPKVSFDLEPISLDRGSRQVTLLIGDQKVVNRHDPPRRTRLEWPTPQSSRARLVFSPTAGDSEAANITESGEWALFRLLDHAKVSHGSGGDTFDLTFEVLGHYATFRLHADSVTNPFFLPAVERFRCLDRL